MNASGYTTTERILNALLVIGKCHLPSFSFQLCFRKIKSPGGLESSGRNKWNRWEPNRNFQ